MIKKNQQIDPKKTEALIQQILAVGLEIRYAAICDGIKVLSHQRQDLLQSSASTSDLYEELFVNPTLMKILTQRGSLDCGGFEYALVRYGNFFQFVTPIAETAHISIAIEADGDITRIIPLLRDKIKTFVR